LEVLSHTLRIFQSNKLELTTQIELEST